MRQLSQNVSLQESKRPNLLEPDHRDQNMVRLSETDCGCRPNEMIYQCLDEMIACSRFGRYVTYKSSVEGRFVVLDDAAFEAKWNELNVATRSAIVQGFVIPESRTQPDGSVVYVEVAYIRQRFSDKHVLWLHEALHMLDATHTWSMGGKRLIEGICEYIAREIALEHGVSVHANSYSDEIPIVRRLASMYGEDMLASVHFYGDFSSVHQKVGMARWTLLGNLMDQHQYHAADSLVSSWETSTYWKVHEVKVKETLWRISQMYDVSVAQLKGYNGLSDNTIYPEQLLRVRRLNGGNNEAYAGGNPRSPDLRQPSPEHIIQGKVPGNLPMISITRGYTAFSLWEDHLKSFAMEFPEFRWAQFRDYAELLDLKAGTRLDLNKLVEAYRNFQASR